MRTATDQQWVDDICLVMCSNLICCCRFTSCHVSVHAIGWCNVALEHTAVHCSALGCPYLHQYCVRIWWLSSTSWQSWGLSCEEHCMTSTQSYVWGDSAMCLPSSCRVDISLNGLKCPLKRLRHCPLLIFWSPSTSAFSSFLLLYGGHRSLSLIEVFSSIKSCCNSSWSWGYCWSCSSASQLLSSRVWRARHMERWLLSGIIISRAFTTEARSVVHSAWKWVIGSWDRMAIRMIDMLENTFSQVGRIFLSQDVWHFTIHLCTSAFNFFCRLLKITFLQNS